MVLNAAVNELAQGQVVPDAGIMDPAAAPGLISPNEGVAQATAISTDRCSGMLRHMYAAKIQKVPQQLGVRCGQSTLVFL